VKHKISRESFTEKLDTIRNMISMRFPSVDVRNLDKTMARLAHYHYDKKKYFVIGESRELYDFLLLKGYNPFTVYRWMLLEKLPEDMRFQLKERQISQKKAVSEAFDRRHETTSSLGESIKDIGLSLIRRM